MEIKYNNRYRVNSARLPSWDYGSNSWYFITISTKNKIKYFGELDRKGNLDYSILGDFAVQCWYTISHFHPFVKLDQFILMPDHFHGVLKFSKEKLTSKRENRFGPQSENLASVVRGFKSVVTSFANRHKIDFHWQPKFHDRVIRNEFELSRIRNYILLNPIKHARSNNQ